MTWMEPPLEPPDVWPEPEVAEVPERDPDDDWVPEPPDYDSAEYEAERLAALEVVPDPKEGMYREARDSS